MWSDERTRWGTGRPPPFIELPLDHVGGVTAHGVRSSVGPGGFTLDFFVRDDRYPDVYRMVVTARVRLDPTAMQQALGIMATQLSEWEAALGALRQAPEA